MRTSEAFIEILHCVWVILRNGGNGVNRIVKRWPWLCMAAVTGVSFVCSATCVMKARAERDSANHAMVKLQQQVESLSCAVEAGKEARRWK